LEQAEKELEIPSANGPRSEKAKAMATATNASIAAYSVKP